MALISVWDLDDEVRERLRVRAAHHGRSMEAEIRTILTDAVRNGCEPLGLAQALMARFGALGGVDLELPPRVEHTTNCRRVSLSMPTARDLDVVVLDSNVVSELMRARPDPRVVSWIGRRPPMSIWTTAITLAEVWLGIFRLPD